ncbi:MAG: peptidylprolyl isomerase [Calditrichia bacterium]
MMTKLRQMTFFFIWILVIAFVGLMVVEWGMDYSGGANRGSNVVGRVNNTEITIQDYEREVQNMVVQERERTGGDLDDAQIQQLRNQAWERLVQRVLFTEQISENNLRATDREVYLQIRYNPPDVIRQNPNFQEEGQFSMDKYQSALLNAAPEQWRPLEDYYRELIPFSKLQEMVTSSVMVTEEEMRSDYFQNNVSANVKFLYVPVSAYSQDSVEVSEKEMRQYYDEHKEDFKVEEKRQLNYVTFPNDATPEDSARVYRNAEEILKEAKEGVDFAQLADEWSEDPSVQNNHGDLGYFESGRMVPEFSEAAFAAKPGEIVGPVKSQFGPHIIKVHDKKTEDGTEKVHASHILLKFNPSPQTTEDARQAASRFAEAAQEEGFKKTADLQGKDVQQTVEFAERPFIPGFGQMPSAIDWAFSSEKGDISRVLNSNQGYVVFEVASVQPEGYRPFEDVKDVAKNRVQFQKHKEMARRYAEQIAEKINNGTGLEEAAEEGEAKDIALIDSTGSFNLAQRNIPRIGSSPVFAAAAFTLEPGKISRMLETERGFYFIKVVERGEFDEQAYQQQKETIRTRLLNQEVQRVFNKWYENLKNEADIEDYRDQFYS